MLEILLSVLALGLLIMLITKRGRVMLKGFFGLFITDLASTPAGAKAVFEENIANAIFNIIFVLSILRLTVTLCLISITSHSFFRSNSI